MRNTSSHQCKFKMSGIEKIVNKTDVRHFLQKTCNKEVSEVSHCSRAKQRQRNVQKSVLHVQSCFFAN